MLWTSVIEYIQRVLQLLANAGELRTVRLRALLTSRPEKKIEHGFLQVLQGVYQGYILQDISKSAVDDDIYIFFNHKFERTLPTDWPGERAIKHLVQKAAGLFTVLKNSNYNEQEKETFYKMLKEILGSIVLLFSPLSADSLASLINL